MNQAPSFLFLQETKPGIVLYAIMMSLYSGSVMYCEEEGAPGNGGSG